MATEKQIAANRANARLSTGPKTSEGSARSSANALRHGLSRPLQANQSEVEAIATWLSSEEGYLTGVNTQQLALTELDMQRIRLTRFQVMASCFQGNFRDLKGLLAIDRYQQAVRVKRKRACRLG